MLGDRPGGRNGSEAQYQHWLARPLILKPIAGRLHPT